MTTQISHTSNISPVVLTNLKNIRAEITCSTVGGDDEILNELVCDDLTYTIQCLENADYTTAKGWLNLAIESMYTIRYQDHINRRQLTDMLSLIYSVIKLVETL